MSEQIPIGIFDRATKVLGGPDQAKAWLERPSLSLAEQKPIDLLATTRGKKLVLAELGRIGRIVLS